MRKHPEKIWVIPNSTSLIELMQRDSSGRGRVKITGCENSNVNETVWCNCPAPGTDDTGEDARGYISIVRYREIVRQRDEYKRRLEKLMKAVNEACRGG